MHSPLFLLIISALAAAGSWYACRWVRQHLLKTAVLDHPNDRSLHTAPCPRGGGLGMWMAVLPLWVVLSAYFGFLSAEYALFFGMALLLGVSWLDDNKPLPISIRLAVQIAAVIIGLNALPVGQHVFFSWMPLWLDRLLAGFCWLWFVNLTNFMDGMDGLSGAETAHISLGFLLVALIAGIPFSGGTLLAACLFGAALGYLYWNYPPARLFLGDVGSIPLGFLLGYLMLLLACNGYLAIALALPLYYVADATITLLRRIKEKKKFWQSHREHFYQQAALAAGTHTKVLYPIIAANGALLILCMLALKTGVWLLLLAPIIVGVLIWYLKKLANKTLSS